MTSWPRAAAWVEGDRAFVVPGGVAGRVALEERRDAREGSALGGEVERAGAGHRVGRRREEGRDRRGSLRGGPGGRSERRGKRASGSRVVVMDDDASATKTDVMTRGRTAESARRSAFSSPARDASSTSRGDIARGRCAGVARG